MKPNKAQKIVQMAIDETGSFKYPVVVPKVIEIAEREAGKLKGRLQAGSYLKMYYRIHTTGDIIVIIDKLLRRKNAS